MNKHEADLKHQGIASPRMPAGRQSKSVGKTRRSREQARSASGRAAGDSLSRDSLRLLAALGLPGARAFVDPTDQESVILHKQRSGISVGAGRFPLTVADALTR